ncbi:unnamed protein product [Symbiodinium natans]|uniref:Uncharacterized protein n=1 Tax=Symbiodinium natans TaxID=878477 RepID=A0A812SF96_9DINO|nr:unnamed protein product [Symbiodinium natans]
MTTAWLAATEVKLNARSEYLTCAISALRAVVCAVMDSQGSSPMCTSCKVLLIIGCTLGGARALAPFTAEAIPDWPKVCSRARMGRTSLAAEGKLRLGNVAGEPEQGVVRERFVNDTPCVTVPNDTIAWIPVALSRIWLASTQVTCSPGFTGVDLEPAWQSLS